LGDGLPEEQPVEPEIIQAKLKTVMGQFENKEANVKADSRRLVSSG